MDKDTLIGDILRTNPNNAAILAEMGMHCSGCPVAQGETIEEACLVHNLNVEDMLARLSS